MSVEEIEKAIRELSGQEVARLTTWLADYHAQLWDKQIEGDLDSGRLDALLAEVDKEYQEGLAKPI